MSQSVPNKSVTLVTCGAKGGYLHIPLNILYIAESLIQHGYDPRLVDLRVQNLTENDLRGALFVGISHMTGSQQIPFALKTAETAKSLGIPVVFGGTHPSIMPKQTAAHPLVDIAVKGDGEDVILEIAEYFQGKRSIESIKGIAYKNSTGEVLFTGDRPFPPFTRVTHLPYHLLSMEKYSATQADFDFQSSRGCPHRCAFCAEVSLFHRRWRAKPALVIIEEIEKIIKLYNPKRIYFVDSNFFCSRKRVTEFCNEIISKGIKARFFAECRFDYFVRFEDEFLNMLKKAGFEEIEFGGESGSNATLSVIKKDITRKEIIESIKKCKKLGIKSFTSFMIGFPGETDEEMNETLDTYDEILQIDPRGARINGMFVFSPFPGTELSNVVVQKWNFKVPDSLDKWAKFELYDSANITWMDEKRKRKLQTISTLVRFFFAHKTLMDWSWSERIKRHRGFFKAVGSYLFNNFIYILAIRRWKHRFFALGFDVWLWKVIFLNFMGRK